MVEKICKHHGWYQSQLPMHQLWSVEQNRRLGQDQLITDPLITYLVHPPHLLHPLGLFRVNPNNPTHLQPLHHRRGPSRLCGASHQRCIRNLQGFFDPLAMTHPSLPMRSHTELSADTHQVTRHDLDALRRGYPETLRWLPKSGDAKNLVPHIYGHPPKLER